MELPNDNLKDRWSPRQYSSRWALFTPVNGQPKRYMPHPHEASDIGEVDGEVFKTALEVIQVSTRRVYTRRIDGFQKTLYVNRDYDVLHQSSEDKGLEVIEIAADSREELKDIAATLELKR